MLELLAVHLWNDLRINKACACDLILLEFAAMPSMMDWWSPRLPLKTNAKVL